MSDPKTEALEFAAEHLSSDWPKRCREIVWRARAALAERPEGDAIADAWVENRPKVLDALRSAGFMLVNRGDRFEVVAAPLAKSGSDFLSQVREAIAASKAAPIGTAVPLPAAVTAEFRKFMRDEPSAFDAIPWGEFKALTDPDQPRIASLTAGDERFHVICVCPDCTAPKRKMDAQQRPALVDALRGLLASLSRDPTEQELRAAAHEFTVRADRLSAKLARREDVDG